MLFDWDAGNREKCQQHGVSVEAIEAVLSGHPYIAPDPHPREVETRFQAIDQTPEGRHVFIVFTFRERPEGLAVRPISARYMHAKEVRKYEQDQARKG
jgi:uncharacterized DUF497 family protein